MGITNLTPLISPPKRGGDSLCEVVDGKPTNLRIAMVVADETPITEDARESAIQTLVGCGVSREDAESLIEQVPPEK